MVRRLLAALAIAAALTVHPARAQEIDVPTLIDQAIDDYGMGYWRARIRSIAWCESRYDPAARNRRSGAAGVFQFIPSTARNVGINPWDVWQNVYAAVGMMARGGWSHWYACDPGRYYH